MRKIRGFTLIELIIAIVVIGIIAAAATPVMIASMGAYNATLDTAMTLDKLRYASERMAREIREIDPSQQLIMSTTALQFTRVDYLTPGAGTPRVVSITQSTGAGTVNLSYGTVSPAPVLTDQLSELVFAYYDAGGLPTTAAGAVRYVEINLSLALNGQTYAQRTRVALRNH